MTTIVLSKNMLEYNMADDCLDLPLEAETPAELTEELGAAVEAAQLVAVPMAERFNGLLAPLEGYELTTTSHQPFSDWFIRAIEQIGGFCFCNEVWLPKTLAAPSHIRYVTYQDWLMEQAYTDYREYYQDMQDAERAGCL